MLVPSMTLAEIKKEIEKDYPIVLSKSGYLLADLKRESIKKKTDTIVRFYDYYSKFKNNWIIKVKTLKKGGHTGYIAYYYGDHGLVAAIYLADKNRIAYHTAHFFKRFNERLHLTLTTPNDIMRAYLDENESWMVQFLEYFGPGLRKMFITTHHGYALGTFDENQGFYKLNTFITRDMLRGSQIDMAKTLEDYLHKYEQDARTLNERTIPSGHN